MYFYLNVFIDWFWLTNILSIKTNQLQIRMCSVLCHLLYGPEWGIDEYEYMDAHMFLFNWTLLDAEGLGHSVGLLQLQLLLLRIWQDSLRRSVFGRPAEGF